jgi:DNA-binding response OmpR family regulator
VARVLVADINAPQRARIQAALEADGHAIARAASLSELQALLARNQFQLILCDANVHGGDTWELVKGVCARLIDATPVVVVSEELQVAQRVLALRAGAADFVAKTSHVTLLTRPLLIPYGAAVSASPCRVLVVDDSTTYGHALADELSLDGHDVVLSASAAETRDYLAWQIPDVVLLDVFLPDGDGVDLAKGLRANVATRELPILMLTGRESTNIRKRATEARVSAFAAKDTPLVELRSTVMELAKARRVPASRTQLVAVEARSVPADLFLRVVAASGLSEVLGRSTIDRALQRAGVDGASLTPRKLKTALPQIEHALSTFLPPQDAKRRLAAISFLAMEGSVTS